MIEVAKLTKRFGSKLAVDNLSFTVEKGDPLYLNSLMAGSWYPFFGIALVILGVFPQITDFSYDLFVTSSA